MMQDAAVHLTITEFLQQLGFADFIWRGEPLTLAFERSGTLMIEPHEQGLLLVRLQEISDYDCADLIPKALRAVHYDQPLPLRAHTGMKGPSQLAFIVALSRQQLSIAGLNEALGVLDYLHQQLNQ
ncbi:YopN chaperone SycN-like protein [Hahella sp. CR1]|uniref:YopN chaperone SycN-like protein n=1 Tax=Hahella sp. CR1 TaxID=2992807 RepID=UPI002441CBB5|nr:YopN chaperone SycN-like protein [Hahella sp. CR1]MDG9672077.1 YopN chaperone SycN-like protein [Hahella sp. CR1]